MRDVCGESVLVGEGLGAINFGKLLVLNETAAWIWKEAEDMEDFSIESITKRFCEEYDVAEEIAKSDIDEIIHKWMDINVIQT